MSMGEYWALVKASEPELLEKINKNRDFFNADEQAELKAMKEKFATKDNVDG